MRSSSAPVVLVVGIHVRLVQARRDVRPCNSDAFHVSETESAATYKDHCGCTAAHHRAIVVSRLVDSEAMVLDGESPLQTRAVVELGRRQPGFPRCHPARLRGLLDHLALLHEVARLLCFGSMP